MVQDRTHHRREPLVSTHALTHSAVARSPPTRRTAARCLQARLRVGLVDDPLEREADRAADAVMRGEGPGVIGSVPPVAQRACAACDGEREEAPIQRKCASCAGESGNGQAEQAASAIASGGVALPAETRAYFEPRFGLDLSNVRIHADARADEAANAITARAFTVGSDIGFAAGEYAPHRAEGRHLIAHELAHSIQQNGGECRVQRSPVRIVPAGSQARLGAGQRRADASCDIQCRGAGLGTMHVMPIMFGSGREGPAFATSAGADGIRVSIHFIRNRTVPPAASPCARCTDFKVIQVVNTNSPSTASQGRGGRYVDNRAGPTPFYDDVYQSRTGRHTVGYGLPGAGDEVRTTRSVYDAPFRSPEGLAPVRSLGYHWNAEACITCVRTGRDIVLGCATYGYRREWNAGTNSHGPVQINRPGCLTSPSDQFITTLHTDSSTSSYDFEI